MMTRSRGFLVILVAMALAAGSCTVSSGDPADGRLDVVATTGMIADAARAVGGDFVRVTGLMGPGVDPHLYDATRADQARLARADVVLYHGLHLEGKMADQLGHLAADAARAGRMVVAVAAAVPQADLIRNLRFGEYPDPHVWFDLRLWSFAVREVIRALAEADPAHARSYEENGDRYLDRLDAAHAWALEETAKIPAERRKIVTSHDAYNYFARAYGYEVHGLQGISTETQAGIEDIEAAIAYVEKHRVPRIFAETSVNPRAIELVSRRSGASVSERHLFSDALGPVGTDTGTLIGVFRYNVEAIVEALAP